METKKYFGMKEYTAIADTGRKTASGVPILKVLYTDGKSVTTTEKFFNLVKSEVPLDANQFRDLLYPKLIPELYTVLTDYNISYSDFEAIAEKLKSTIRNTTDNAINYVLGVDNFADLTFVMINEINDKKAESTKNSTVESAPVTGTDSNTSSESGTVATV